MKINQSNHLSFGNLIVKTTRENKRITSENLLMNPHTMEEKLAVGLIKEHGQNSTVQQLDENGYDVLCQVYAAKNKDGLITNYCSSLQIVDKNTQEQINDKKEITVKPYTNFKIDKESGELMLIDSFKKIKSDSLKNFPDALEKASIGLI